VTGADQPGDIDDLLRARGANARWRAPAAPAPPPNLGDVRRRRDRQRHQHLVAGAVVIALAVVGVGAVASAARGPVGGEVEAGGAAGGGRGAAPAGGSGPTTTTTTTTVPTTTSTRRGSTRGTAEPATTSPTTGQPRTTAPPDPPGPAAEPGGGIRSVSFTEGFAYPADECGDDRSVTGPMVVRKGRASVGGIDRLVVAGVQYGDLAPAAGEEAVVIITCPGKAGVVHAWVYAAEATAAPGVRRVTAVDLAASTVTTLDQEGVLSWRLADARAGAGTVIGRWAGFRAADPADRPSVGFTVEQRWTGSVWEPLGPLQLDPTS
jgi:hypothetical protein